MPARKTTTKSPAPTNDEPQGTDTVNRNFALPVEQAEWLREAAFEHRVPQAAIVREAIDDVRKKYARKKR